MNIGLAFGKLAELTDRPLQMHLNGLNALSASRASLPQSALLRPSPQDFNKLMSKCVAPLSPGLQPHTMSALGTVRVLTQRCLPSAARAANSAF